MSDRGITGGPGAWLRDFAMGCRFALAGGREGWIRAGLTAVGVGLGVALLLVAVSVPTIFAERAERGGSINFGFKTVSSGPADNTLLYEDRETTFRADRVIGKMVQPEGPDAPIPPGIRQLPPLGQMYVSPALAELLASEDGDLLRPRIDYPIAGVIGKAGLTGPDEYRYYVTTDDLSDDSAIRIDTIGQPFPPNDIHPILLLLLIVGVVVLLLPVAMFVAVAVRFGGERRDRRLAALRLMGADRKMTLRMSAGESLVGALAGLVVGAGIFVLSRPLLENIVIWDFSVFASDVVPDPLLAALVVVAVPVTAVVVTWSAMRKLIIEPLGVVREGAGAQRRLWWRLILPVVGLAMLFPMISQERFIGEGLHQVLIITGVLSLLLSTALLLPWVVEAIVRRMRGGSVPWQLATRRLQISGGGTGRVVNGIAVAVAGGIALQTLFFSVETRFADETGVEEDKTLAVVSSPFGVPAEQVDTVAAELADIPDTGSVSWAQELDTVAVDTDDEIHSLLVVDCDQISEYIQVTDCANGDVFAAGDADYRVPDPGQELEVFNPDGTEIADPPTWTVPDIIDRADLTVEYAGYFFGGLVVTPGAIDDALRELGSVELRLSTDAAAPDSVEHIRNVVETAGQEWNVGVVNSSVFDSKYASIRQGLLVGVTATMILIGLSLLVSTLEQLQERRRLLAVLMAFGTRRRTLLMSVLWQTAVPVVLGLVLALGTGTLLGGALLRITGAALMVNWGDILAITAAGGLLVLAVTVLTIPALWRMMRPGGIRTE